MVENLEYENSEMAAAKRYVRLLGFLYFIALIWVLVFKCNLNEFLYVAEQRTQTIWERLDFALSRPMFVESIHCIISGTCPEEIMAFFFNFFALIPFGMTFGFFFKGLRACFLSFITILCIEVFQLISCYGGLRLDDIVMNSLGAFVGVLIVKKLIVRMDPKQICKIARTLIYFSVPLDVFFVVNTIIHFPE